MDDRKSDSENKKKTGTADNNVGKVSNNAGKSGKKGSGKSAKGARKKAAERKVIALPGAAVNGAETEREAQKQKRRNPLFEKITSENSLIQIKGWCMEGAVNQEIADRLGISEATLYRYQQQSEELREAMASGKEVVDYRVENALLRRALGYEYTETVTEKDGPRVKLKVIKKQMPPDVTAGIFWLRNRRADKWKQKPEYIPEDSGTGVVVMPEIMEELEAMEQEAEGRDAGCGDQEETEKTAEKRVEGI